MKYGKLEVSQFLRLEYVDMNAKGNDIPALSLNDQNCVKKISRKVDGHYEVGMLECGRVRNHGCQTIGY